MRPQPQRHYRAEDYFFLEEGSTVRHEFFNGEIFAMAGGSVAHNQIAANVLVELGNAVKGKRCRALGSDMRLATPDGLLTYPDLMVISGTPQTTHGRHDVVTNPTLLAEVLSDATRTYDLGEKFELYKAIPSLHEYLVIEQRTRQVRLYTRAAAGDWPLAIFEQPEAIVSLPSVGATLRLSDIYDRVFEE